MTQLGRKYEEVQEECVKISVKELKTLGNLPLCVEIIRVLPPPPGDPFWNEEASQFVFLHVRSPYSPLRMSNQSLTYSPWCDFIERIEDFLRKDKDSTAAILNVTGISGRSK